MKMIRILLTCLTLAFQPAWADDNNVSAFPARVTGTVLSAAVKDGALVTLRVGNRRIRVEIANTPQSREHGLMQRNFLCEDCGMLFVFEKADKYSFWMKDTLIPLSIAFVTPDGIVTNIEEMLPLTTDPHNSDGDVLYALEMNAGWFSKNNISPNDKVQGIKPAQSSIP